MADNSLQLTLREMRAVFTSTRAMAVMAGVIVLLGISGPFGTFEALPVAQRVAYWGAICLLTFSTGSFFSTWVFHVLLGRDAPLWVQIPLNALAAALPVVPAIMLINLISFGTLDLDEFSVGMTFIYGFIIAAVISTLFAVFARPGLASTLVDQSATPRILERLNVTQRGDLISISVQDHYVEVSTSKARTLLLMRLGDAIAETGGVAGVQIHRSHWVALDGVSAVKRKAGKVIVETRAGDNLPVSRTFMPAAKNAGLIA